MNTDNKFTAGEWTIKTDPLPSRKFLQIRANGEMIANVLQIEKGKFYSANDVEETFANAKLISAAPDMYKALIDILSNYNANLKSGTPVAINEIRVGISIIKKAIDKATK